MKATFLIENLQKKLPFLSHAVSTRGQMPILGNFLITLEKNNIKISATDLEIGIESSVPASVEKEGSVTVPAKTFSDFVQSISSGKAELSFDEKMLSLKGERAEANFQTMPSDEYPRLIEDKGVVLGSLEKATLEKELQRIVFSASQDQGRASLSGVLIKKEGKSFSLVATDGYRLSLKKGFSLSGGAAFEKILVPSRAIRELLSVKEDSEGVVVSVSEKTSQIIFSIGETFLVTRLLEAEFPAYEKIIPTSFSTRAEVFREDLLGAVKTGSVFARETANIVKLTLSRKGIVVSANTPSIGDDKIVVDSVVSGEENSIAFNARYLLDFLSGVGDEAGVIFEMSGPLSPGVFRLKNDPEYLHLIMPIKIQDL
jgi:DNA polymerase III subunit beta